MTALATPPKTAPAATTGPTAEPDPLSGDHALEHVKYQIANTPVNDYPYPHQHVRGVFPETFYREMLRNFPAPEHFRALIENYPKRGTIELHKPGALDALDPARRDFWAWFVRQFGSKHFTSFVLDRYGPLMGGRFRHHVKPQMYLFRDSGGYGIGPHTDTPKKVVTMLFYLPPDDSQRHAGTTLVVPRDKSYEHHHTGHETWDNYRAARTAEFTPNTVLSFVVTDRSLHAVRPTPADTVRQSLQFFICTE